MRHGGNAQNRRNPGRRRCRLQPARRSGRGSHPARLRGLRSDLIDPAIAAHHGRIVKRTGDGIIIEFRSVVDAVRCAIEVQNGMVERNAACHRNDASSSASAFIWATSSRRTTAISWATASISPRDWRASASQAAICLSEDAYRQERDRVKETFNDLGRKSAQEHRAPGPRLCASAWHSRPQKIRTAALQDSRPRFRCPTSPRSPSCPSRT